MKIRRRNFLGMFTAGLLLPLTVKLDAASSGNFRIRTITAGIRLKDATDFASLESAVVFLQQARADLETLGYEVQTLRIATQPVAQYVADWNSQIAMEMLLRLDQFAVKHNLEFSIGPVITDDRYHSDFAAWAARLIEQTSKTSFTVSVASKEQGIQYQSLRTAAEAIAAISRATADGAGNFRFAATACCPPAIPFFPAAYHAGNNAFGIGLESPGILQDAFSGLEGDIITAKKILKRDMELALRPIQDFADRLALGSGRIYSGIDVSPATGLKMKDSICHAIEMLSGSQFGSISTLSACAAITDVLKSLDIKTCGYSGLFFPVLEDSLLARRAMEGSYGISDLLLYSSVCGTGLDVIPLPGDVSVASLASIINDVAALAVKYNKPLSARLFPVPGKKSGDIVHFDNPYLTDSSVMSPE